MHWPLKGLVLFVFLLISISSCGLSPPPSSNPVAPAQNPGAQQTDVLIYGGVGSWQNEIDSLKNILYTNGATYNEATSPQIDAMSLDELMQYRLLIIPGGDAVMITQSLSAATHARLRKAVQERGLDYLGFCAGAWLAVAPAPSPGEDVSYGIGFVDGPILQPNFLEDQGKEFALTTAKFPNSADRNLLWYGGPITPEISGGVVARYSDDTPAITQIWSGEGLVILSGFHPAATKSILGWLGIFDKDAIAPDLAWEILDAGIHKKTMPAF